MSIYMCGIDSFNKKGQPVSVDFSKLVVLRQCVTQASYISNT